jgi:hypothetical protein
MPSTVVSIPLTSLTKNKSNNLCLPNPASLSFAVFTNSDMDLRNTLPLVSCSNCSLLRLNNPSSLRRTFGLLFGGGGYGRRRG